MAAKKVEMKTSHGDIVIELDEKKSPVTVKNFIGYVEDKFFDGMIFHRVIPDFMIQGGGFNVDMKEKKTKAPIINEGGNGLKNARGTLAMARTNDPDSATAQFFINLKDNAFLNAAPGNPGYAVFGKVVEGMDTVDSIASVETDSYGFHDDVPTEPVVIDSARVISE